MKNAMRVLLLFSTLFFANPSYAEKIPLLWIRVDFSQPYESIIESHMILSSPLKPDRAGSHPNPSARFFSIPIFNGENELISNIEVENPLLSGAEQVTEAERLKSYRFTLRIPVDGFRPLLKSVRYRLLRKLIAERHYKANPSSAHRLKLEVESFAAKKMVEKAHKEMIRPIVKQIIKAFQMKGRDSKHRVYDKIESLFLEHFLKTENIERLNEETSEVLKPEAAS